MVGTRKAIRSLVENAELVALIQEAARTGVAILVETPVHARTLAELLPGWAVWTANELEVAKPAPGCGVIATELAADETVISAGVLIRAAGTKWPLPEIDWPWFGDVEHGVLIDFKDEYHQLARKNAAARMASYQEEGMSVWEFNATSEKTPT